jgi:diguanylate cyclase (GGDEF)-like protein
MLGQFMPHGMCFAWQQNMLLLQVISDAVIALAYFSIPLTLAFFAAKRTDLPFKWAFRLFGLFIVACGTTHLLAIWVIWHPDYWLDGSVKAFTAVVSIFTAVALVGIMPAAFALRSPRDLEELNLRLAGASAEAQATIDNLGDGVVVYDQNLAVVRTNHIAEDMLETIAGNNGCVVDADEVALPPGGWPAEKALASGEPQQNVVIGIGEAHAREWIAASATPARLPGGVGEVDRVVLSLHDVTELKTREIGQRRYAHQLEALHTIASMTTGERQGRIEAALLVGITPLGLERAFLETWDKARDELIVEASVAVSGDSADLPPVGTRYPLGESFIGRAINCKDVLAIPDVAALGEQGGLAYYSGGGSYIAVPVCFDGNVYGAIGFFGKTPRATPFTPENIEFVKLAGELIASALQRALENDRLDALAFFDPLTGLPNRVLLHDRLGQTILASHRRGEQFAVLFLDLDGFKAVNDKFGHAAGDAVLKTVAARLKHSLRESDTLARIGGDEFVIIGPGTATRAAANIFAERILRAMRKPLREGTRYHELTVSIGVSFFPVDGSDMTKLLERADDALYAAKNEGKNRVKFASEEASTSDVGAPISNGAAHNGNGRAERGPGAAPHQVRAPAP